MSASAPVKTFSEVALLQRANAALMDGDSGKCLEICRLAAAVQPSLDWSYVMSAQAVGREDRLVAATSLLLRSRRLAGNVSPPIINILYAKIRSKFIIQLGREDYSGAYLSANLLRPEYFLSAFTMARASKEVLKIDDCIFYFERALEMLQSEPDGPEKEQCRFEIRQYVWLAYRAKGDIVGSRKYDRTDDVYPRQTMPSWAFEDGRGKSIVAVFDMGLGDAVQDLRHCRILAEEYGFHVRVAASAPLKALFRTYPYAESVFSLDEAVPRSDYICSSARQLRFFDDRMGDHPFPYLAADPVRVELWRRRLAGVGQPLTIAYIGCSRYGVPDTRAMSADFGRRLAELGGVRVLNLTRNLPSPAAETPEEAGWDAPYLEIGHLVDQEADGFLDTAAIMVAADLTVSCDTVTAHLAGALGRPLWIGLSYRAESRWRMTGTTTDAYPSARLFRQASPACWEGPLHEMRAALADLLPARM